MAKVKRESPATRPWCGSHRNACASCGYGTHDAAAAKTKKKIKIATGTWTPADFLVNEKRLDMFNALSFSETHFLH